MADAEATQLAGWIGLEGCYNFRDLGGYRARDGREMRTGQVFRSDGLHHLTPSDVEQLCGALGLAAVIDLRSVDEVDEDGVGPIGQRARIHSVPLFPHARGSSARMQAEQGIPSDMGELYYLMLTAAREPIAEVVRLLSVAEVPAVFHCSAGKDRTGVISALLLSLLDVPDETIVADYAFSRENIDLINARLSQSETSQRLMAGLPDGAYDADPAAMESFLAKVQAEHGSMLGWAEQTGIDTSTRERLKDRLLG
jgi:protein tyrosine/serine phosphatase